MSYIRRPAHASEFGANSSHVQASVQMPILAGTTHRSDRYQKTGIVPLSPLYLKKSSATLPNGAHFFGANPYLRAGTAFPNATPLVPYLLPVVTPNPTAGTTTPVDIDDNRPIVEGDYATLDNAALSNILVANDDLEYVKLHAILEVQAAGQDLATLALFIKPEVGIWLDNVIGTVMQKGGKYTSDYGLIKVETVFNGGNTMEGNRALIEVNLRVNDIPKDGAILFGASLYGMNVTVGTSGATAPTGAIIKIRGVSIVAKKSRALY